MPDSRLSVIELNHLPQLSIKSENIVSAHQCFKGTDQPCDSALRKTAQIEM
jgi:hypothetical protein